MVQIPTVNHFGAKRGCYTESWAAELFKSPPKRDPWSSTPGLRAPEVYVFEWGNLCWPLHKRLQTDSSWVKTKKLNPYSVYEFFKASIGYFRVSNTIFWAKTVYESFLACWTGKHVFSSKKDAQRLNDWNNNGPFSTHLLRVITLFLNVHRLLFLWTMSKDCFYVFGWRRGEE